MRRKIIIAAAVLVLIVGGILLLMKLRNDRVARRATELGVVLESEIRAFESRDRARPPLFPPASDGTAWEHYGRAFALLQEVTESIDVGDSMLAYYEWESGTEPLTDEARACLRRYDPVVELLRRGANARRIGVPRGLRRGQMTRVDDPEERGLVGSLFDIDSMFETRRKFLLEKGSPETVIEDILILDRVALDLQVTGATWDSVMAGNLRETLASELAIPVGKGELPAPQVDRIERWQESRPGPECGGLSSIEPTWLVLQIDLMHLSQGREEWLPTCFPRRWDQRALIELLRPRPAEAWDTWTWLRKSYPALVARWPGENLSALRNVTDTLKRSVAGRSSSDRLAVACLTEILDARLRVAGAHIEHGEVLAMNIALFRFREKHGRDPETIEEIRPATVRVQTDEGAWHWWSEGDSGPRWVDRGTREERQAKDDEAMKQFMETLSQPKIELPD